MQAIQSGRTSAPGTAAAAAWTKPFLGIQHLGTGNRWATVEDRGSFAELVCWFPGCGFRPDVSKHSDAVQARQAGEAWFGMVGHA